MAGCYAPTALAPPIATTVARLRPTMSGPIQCDQMPGISADLDGAALMPARRAPRLAAGPVPGALQLCRMMRPTSRPPRSVTAVRPVLAALRLPIRRDAAVRECRDHGHHPAPGSPRRGTRRRVERPYLTGTMSVELAADQSPPHAARLTRGTAEGGSGTGGSSVAQRCASLGRLRTSGRRIAEQRDEAHLTRRRSGATARACHRSTCAIWSRVRPLTRPRRR